MIFTRTAQVARVGAAFCALFWVGFGSPAAAATPIHPGDKLQITVYNHPDLSADVTVTGNGDVPVPVVGDVAVEGLDEAQATVKVTAAMASYLRRPAIRVRILQQGTAIFFTGLFVGTQAYQPGESLATAVGLFSSQPNSSSSAPVTSLDLRSVGIERDRKMLPSINVEQLRRTGESGPRLEPGDVILLRAKPVRVDVRGYVSSPTTVYIYRGDTLAQAVAQAGPILPAASLTKIVLRRRGTDTIVSSAGAEFQAPAQDGDVVTLQPAPHVSVLGMVERAGDVSLQGGSTLFNALYEAGGPNRYADLAHIRVVHAGVSRAYNLSRLTHGDLSQDAPVADGDLVFVPEGHRIEAGALTTLLGALASLRFLIR